MKKMILKCIPSGKKVVFAVAAVASLNVYAQTSFVTTTGGGAAAVTNINGTVNTTTVKASNVNATNVSAANISTTGFGQVSTTTLNAPLVNSSIVSLTGGNGTGLYVGGTTAQNSSTVINSATGVTTNALTVQSNQVTTTINALGVNTSAVVLDDGGGAVTTVTATGTTLVDASGNKTQITAGNINMATINGEAVVTKDVVDGAVGSLAKGQVQTNANNIAQLQTTQAAQGQAITDLSKTVKNVAVAANQLSVVNGVATIKDATSLSFDNGTSVNGAVTGTQLSNTALKVGTNAIVIESADELNAVTRVKSGIDRITSDGRSNDGALHIGGQAVGVDPATGAQYSGAPSKVIVDNVLYSQNATSGKSEAVLTTSDLNPVKQQISNLGSQIQANRMEAVKGIAGVAAMASLSNPLPGQNFYVGVGVGTYAGQQAIAIGASARITQNVVAKMSYSSQGTAGASVGFGW